jgi:hypothetical protein
MRYGSQQEAKKRRERDQWFTIVLMGMVYALILMEAVVMLRMVFHGS